MKQEAPDVPPNPGSPEALEQGCRCPVLDNNHGFGNGAAMIGGRLKTVFVMNADCPLHGEAVNYDWNPDV